MSTRSVCPKTVCAHGRSKADAVKHTSKCCLFGCKSSGINEVGAKSTVGRAGTGCCSLAGERSSRLRFRSCKAVPTPGYIVATGIRICSQRSALRATPVRSRTPGIQAKREARTQKRHRKQAASDSSKQSWHMTMAHVWLNCRAAGRMLLVSQACRPKCANSKSRLEDEQPGDDKKRNGTRIPRGFLADLHQLSHLTLIC